MVFESPIGTTIVQAKDFEEAKSKFLDKFNEFLEKNMKKMGLKILIHHMILLKNYPVMNL